MTKKFELKDEKLDAQPSETGSNGEESEATVAAAH